jgi:hypothetical protein
MIGLCLGLLFFPSTDFSKSLLVGVIFNKSIFNEIFTNSLLFWSLFADTILHEIIHMRQYRSRNFKDIPGYESTAYYHRQRQNQEYYGHRDEMGAHSFNIACEMIDRFGYDPAAIRNHMDTLTSRTKRGTFTKFLATFDWDHDHVKVRQMKQKVMKQLEYAVIGRPFKTTTHLTY